MSRRYKGHFVTWLGAAIVIAGLNSSYAAQQPPTSKDPNVDNYVWDLSPLYPNQAAWDAERTYILQRIKTIARLRGTGQPSATALADELDAVADLRTRGAKMAIYGFLVSSVDSSPIAHSKYDVGTALQTAAESAVAFLPQDVLAVGEAQLKTWLRDEPRLRRHRIRILRILREAPHALSPDLQAVVTDMSRWPQTSYDAWSALNEADLGWPTRKNADGKAVALNLNGVINEFQGSEQTDAYEIYLHKLQSLQDLYALFYTRRIEADLTIARQRKFNDGMDALWFLEDGMPEGSHQIMIDVARKNTSTVRRYVKLRGQSLGLNRISYRDLGLDPPVVDRQFHIADALDIAVQASAPLGEAYQQRLRHILTEKWMHLPPWPQKAQSYGIYPPVGGIPPFFVMSYQADYTSARRFMGGVTLMMSDADIPQDGIPENWDDAGIYGNSVIYVGDMLFDDYVTGHAKNRRERIAYLVNALDFDFRYFRYVMWAELDQRVQELIIEGKNPTGAEVSAIYLEVLRRYFGADQPPVVAEIYASEWMTNHLPFGNYQYQFWPPAMAMAASVVGATKSGDSRALKVVDELLGRSDYDRTYQMLNEVGIDLSKPEPYQALIDRMDRQLDKLEQLLNSKE
jgi:oligoendopeptidase F